MISDEVDVAAITDVSQITPCKSYLLVKSKPMATNFFLIIIIIPHFATEDCAYI
jgi:hypothetical protein